MSAPLTPGADEARRLLREELAKSEYANAQPTLLDRIAKALTDWLSSLKFANVQGTPALLLVVLLVLVVAAIVVALVIYGRPRLNRRGTAESGLFGDDDTRSADALRASAAAAAADGDFFQAVIETYRAIARDLNERGILTTQPGTTAHAFGVRASDLFPDHSTAILEASRSFDEVRYLDRPATEAAYRQVRELDEALRKATPRPPSRPPTPADSTADERRVTA